MEKRLIEAAQDRYGDHKDRQGDYEGLNLLLNCYDVWSASPPPEAVDCDQLLPVSEASAEASLEGL